MNPLILFLMLFVVISEANANLISNRVFADSTKIDTTFTDVDNNIDENGRRLQLLSAFFGLDNALPVGSNLAICQGANRKDGLPVVFSHEFNWKTIQAGDFKVTDSTGNVGQITCVTPAPATDEGEFRTVLLVGEFGDANNQAVEVEVTGNILSIDNTYNFKGSTINVVPLERGPEMVWAELVPETQWNQVEPTMQNPANIDNDCPEETKQQIRVVWNGGITKPGGAEIDDLEREKYVVTLINRYDMTFNTIPFAIGDLNDGDNVHILCLDEVGTPTHIYFPAGFVTDPREDLNHETQVEVFID